MTSQIAILNKFGVAIASDTLSTLESGNSAKTLQNTRKMFELGPEHKVVVVNSGNTHINGVPVATLLAKWAETHPDPLDSLENYAWSFIFWLELLSEKELPETKLKLSDFLAASLQDISESVSKQYPDGDKPWWQASIDKFTNDLTYKERYQRLAAREIGKFCRQIESMEDEFYEVEEGESKTLILEEISRLSLLWFPPESLKETTRKKLDKSLWKSTYKKPIISEGACTLGFVGYGAKDFYPRVEDFNFDCVIPGITRYQQSGSQHTNFKNSAGMYRWAQFDAIDTFLKGIHSTFLYDLRHNFKNAAMEQKRVEFENPEDFTPEIQKQWGGMGEAIYDRIETFIGDYQEKHYENLLSTLNFMDTPELSHVAKSLIEMQALAAHNSMNIQTVGGDIEVATIDPKNGIVWRSRLPK